MDRSAHWEQVYRTKGPEQVSWFQAEAKLSRRLIERALPDRAARIVDIGAGASTLVDGLLTSGYAEVTVLDLSSAALQLAQQRVDSLAPRVTWLHADVLSHVFPAHAYDVWHDRAVFHFLTAPEDRVRYVEQVRHAVRPGGIVIVATFAEDGPLRCSGLEVARYAPDGLHAEFGAGFQLVESHREVHTTPAGASQAFTYCVCRFTPQGGVRPAA